MTYRFNSKKELVDGEGKILNLAMAAIRLNEFEKENEELRHRLWRFKRFVFIQKLAGQFNQYSQKLDKIETGSRA